MSSPNPNPRSIRVQSYGGHGEVGGRRSRRSSSSTTFPSCGTDVATRSSASPSEAIAQWRPTYVALATPTPLPPPPPSLRYGCYVDGMDFAYLCLQKTMFFLECPHLCLPGVSKCLWTSAFHGATLACICYLKARQQQQLVVSVQCT
ncbi:epoxide hydrolase 2 [Iris pallida]|uniref:Epoxide hydrolase 2 n=1 Tax=Iris pallida TaxID=29817 RepID=A0AAX6H7F6_IRIPA|nr:epoxide hydrolase 2 [Iris pallida]